MSWLWWVLIIVGVVALFFLAPVLAGALAPKKTTGKLLLKKELKENGVPIEMFPELFFEEEVDQCMKVAKFRNSLTKDPFTVAFTESIVGSAYNIATIYLAQKGNEHALRYIKESEEYKRMKKFNLV